MPHKSIWSFVSVFVSLYLFESGKNKKIRHSVFILFCVELPFSICLYTYSVNGKNMSEHHRKRVSLYDANKLYFFPSVRKSLFSTKTFIPLIFIHPSQKRRNMYEWESKNLLSWKSIKYILLSLRKYFFLYYCMCMWNILPSSISNIFMLCVCCVYFFLFFFYYYFLVLIAFHISRMISCNVACNDGTFVGLLKRNQEFFPFLLWSFCSFSFLENSLHLHLHSDS